MKAAMLMIAALLFAAPASAQDNAPTNPTGPNSGTAPENRGVTGWTGGTRDQKQPEDPVADARAAADQPWMAEGSDLKGASRQFSPKKTVE